MKTLLGVLLTGCLIVAQGCYTQLAVQESTQYDEQQVLPEALPPPPPAPMFYRNQARPNSVNPLPVAVQQAPTQRESGTQRSESAAGVTAERNRKNSSPRAEAR
jgi:hypothetical protein